MRHPFTPEMIWRIVGIQAYIQYKRQTRYIDSVEKYLND